MNLQKELQINTENPWVFDIRKVHEAFDDYNENIKYNTEINQFEALLNLSEYQATISSLIQRSEKLMTDSNSLSLQNRQDIIEQQLSLNFELLNKQETVDFLVQNEFLIQLLSEAYANIKKVFKKKYRLALKLINNYEYFDCPELFIYIKAKLSPEKAFGLMKELDDKWWLDVSSKAKGKLNIDVKFG